jgi:hypothetical protein
VVISVCIYFFLALVYSYRWNDPSTDRRPQEEGQRRRMRDEEGDKTQDCYPSRAGGTQLQIHSIQKNAAGWLS